MRITSDRIIGVLGSAPKPSKIWENQFEGHNDRLAEMAQMDWDRIPDHYITYYYFDDMVHVELQPDLFRHLFPACLKYWYDSLMRNEEAGINEYEFHRALTKGKIVEKMLSPKEQQKLWKFFEDGLIDRIESQTVLDNKCSWIWRFNSLGLIGPLIKPIWENWWKLDHVGKALSAVMYASGLVYASGENPIYGAWTPDKGGGGPYLSEIDATIWDLSWRDDNLSFLKNTLSAQYLIEKLDQAALVLSEHPDAQMAARVANDAKSRLDVIEIQIKDLLEDLARVLLEKQHS